MALPVMALALAWLSGWWPLPAMGAMQTQAKPSFVTRAVYADTKLWLLSDDGTVSSITPELSKREDVILPEQAIDLCVSDGHPAVVTGSGNGSTAWTLRRHSASGWSASTVVSANGDELLAMTCAPNLVVLLTTQRLIEVAAGNRNVIPLSSEVGRGLVSSMYTTSGQLFVGLNAGEWGGGLRRIDLRSGKVVEVQGTAGALECEGPLRTSCDPVNAIVAEPRKTGCLVLAIGLVHMFEQGRLVEVCGDTVRQIFRTPHGQEGLGLQGEPNGAADSVAFFGLAVEDGTIRAVGTDGIYSIGPGGPVRVPLPRFRDIGGMDVSTDLPGLMLVMTAVNSRHSVSGSVPLLVER
jgi:hypothetical protein